MTTRLFQMLPATLACLGLASCAHVLRAPGIDGVVVANGVPQAGIRVCSYESGSVVHGASVRPCEQAERSALTRQDGSFSLPPIRRWYAWLAPNPHESWWRAYAVPADGADPVAITPDADQPPESHIRVRCDLGAPTAASGSCRRED